MESESSSSILGSVTTTEAGSPGIPTFAIVGGRTLCLSPYIKRVKVGEKEAHFFKLGFDSHAQ